MNHSVILRRGLFCCACSLPHIDVRNVLRTSCCVIVLPPLRYFLLPKILERTARVVPIQSTPEWS